MRSARWPAACARFCPKWVFVSDDSAQVDADKWLSVFGGASSAPSLAARPGPLVPGPGACQAGPLLPTYAGGRLSAPTALPLQISGRFGGRMEQFITAEWIEEQIADVDVQSNPYSGFRKLLNAGERKRIAAALAPALNERIRTIAGGRWGQ